MTRPRATTDPAEGRIRFRSRWSIALRYSGLSPNARLVALTASTWMDPDGAGARPGSRALGEATSLSRATVFRALAELDRGGWIRREAGGGRGRSARLTPLVPSWADAIVEDVLSRGRNRLTGETGDTAKPSQFGSETVSNGEGPHARNRLTGDTPALGAFQEPGSDVVEGSEPPWVRAGLSWPEFLRLRREAETSDDPLEEAAGA